MAAENIALAPLKALASKPGVASPGKLPVKLEHSSSPPPLIEDTSGIIEDGESDEQQDAVGSLQAKLQLSTFEYSALEDRFKRLERQYSELQDLASAYSEVIRGSSLAGGQTVSIDRLQAEAGREGLRAKALEADVLRPLIREAGGLQALISQTNTMRSLIDKAGGLRELEQFVSDLRTIRDTLDELKGSRGLVGLAAEIRNLLQSKRNHAELLSEVNGPNGLKVRAAKYEKLTRAFADVQTTTTLQRPSIGDSAMNPDRARMISTTPLEADPDRDLYEAPPPVAKRNNKTGSNNTPLGVPQVQPSEPSLKRKGAEDSASSMSAKRPRVDVGRDSALLQASLPATVSSSADRLANGKQPPIKRAETTGFRTRTQSIGVDVTDSLLGQSNITKEQRKAAALKARSDANQTDNGSTNHGDAGSRPQIQTAPPLKMPDWMHSAVRLGDVGFIATTGVPRYSSTSPTQDVEPHTDARSGPVRFSTAVPTPTNLPTQMQDIVGGAQTVFQTGIAVPIDPRLNQLSIWKDYLKHAVAFWVGAPHASAAWDAYKLHDLKRNLQIPGDVLAALTGELSRLIPIAKYATYETMPPNHDTCILRYLIEGHRPSGVPQERTACRLCTQHGRPCALLQDIGGSRTIVFMPLRGDVRAGLRWSEKAHWIQGVQKD